MINCYTNFIVLDVLVDKKSGSPELIGMDQVKHLSRKIGGQFPLI
jgi:hypothetical protein